MRQFFAYCFVIMLLSLPVTIFIQANGFHFTSDESTIKIQMQPSLPGPDLNQANWTHNHWPNPSFEDWSSPWSPEQIYGSSSPDYLTKPVESPHPVMEGSRSLLMEGRSLDGRNYNFDVINANLHLQKGLDNLTLRFDWWIDQNIDYTLNHDRIFLHLDFYPSYNIYYLLNGSLIASNSTHTAYFTLGGPIQQWNRFDHNITHDILSVPEFGGTIPSDMQLEIVRFEIQIQGGIQEYVRAYFDDVQLINETNGYEWINGTTRNGNFEGPGSWGHLYSGLDPGLRSQSIDAHSGSWSLNHSVISWGNTSWSSSSYSPYVRLTAQNPANLFFWWKLDEIHNPTEDTYCYVLIECFNSTDDFDFLYFLGHGGTVPHPTITNVSEQNVFYAENFNTTGTWHLFTLDLVAKAGQLFITDEVVIERIEFDLRTEDPQTHLVLLIDDVSLVSAAINGGDFEDQRAPGNPIRGWGENDEYSEFLVTSTAYSGSKAANLTVEPGENFYGYQKGNYRPLNGTRETYFDIMWRLDQYSQDEDNYVYFQIYLEGGKTLYYLLTPTIASWFVNDTTEAYFYVTGVGTLNSWIPMHRDLVHDYEAAFGSIPDTTIDDFNLEASCDTGGPITVLIDDYYLYDDPAPTVSNVVQIPQAPWFYDNVNITADASDQDLDTVQLHYRVNEGSWQQVTMLHQTSNTFNATIPPQFMWSVVEYYITANDSWGLITTNTNDTAFYTYTVVGMLGPPPIPWMPLLAVVVVIIVVIILAIYIFVLRPRQQE